MGLGSRQGSQAKHIDASEFKEKTIIVRAEEKATETERRAKTNAEEYLSGSSIEAERNKPVPKKRKAAEEEVLSLRTQNAAYKEHIAFKNRDTDDLFNRLQQAQ